MRLRNIIISLFTLSSLAIATPAHAALDEALAGADVQTVRLGAHDLKQRERGDVKELADASGKVAAVSWRGFVDARPILGSHLAEFENALKTAKRYSLHIVHAKTDDIEISIVSYGAMRRTTVTLGKRLPEGVKLDAIR